MYRISIGTRRAVHVCAKTGGHAVQVNCNNAFILETKLYQNTETFTKSRICQKNSNEIRNSFFLFQDICLMVRTVVLVFQHLL